MANFVISLAHRNQNEFTLEELQKVNNIIYLKFIIYNYNPINVFSREATTMA